MIIRIHTLAGSIIEIKNIHIQYSAGVNGGPCSHVCAHPTLQLSPHQWNLFGACVCKKTKRSPLKGVHIFYLSNKILYCLLNINTFRKVQIWGCKKMNSVVWTWSLVPQLMPADILRCTRLKSRLQTSSLIRTSHVE